MFLMSIFEGLGPSILCGKIEKTRFMKEEMDREMFISRLSQQCCFDF